MKKTVILLLLSLGLLASAQPPLYKAYAQREQVAQAAYLKNYRIEGIRVDVTLLRAADSAAFHQLLSELDMPYTPSTHTPSMLLCLRRDDAQCSLLKPIEGRVSMKEACLVGASEAELTIYVFHHLRTKARFHKILNYILQKQRQRARAQGF